MNCTNSNKSLYERMEEEKKRGEIVWLEKRFHNKVLRIFMRIEENVNRWNWVRIEIMCMQMVYELLSNYKTSFSRKRVLNVFMNSIFIFSLFFIIFVLDDKSQILITELKLSRNLFYSTKRESKVNWEKERSNYYYLEMTLNLCKHWEHFLCFFFVGMRVR